MKRTKKCLAILLTVTVILSLAGINASALTYNWSEYKWDLQEAEVGDGKTLTAEDARWSIAGTQMSLVAGGGWAGEAAYIENDPADATNGNKVLRYTRANSTNSTRIEMFYAYNKGLINVYSFKYFIPSTGGNELRVNWSYNAGAKATDIFTYDGTKYLAFGNELVYPQSHPDAGDNIPVEKDKWHTYTVIVNDRGEGIYACVFLDGVNAMTNRQIDAANITGVSYMDRIQILGGGGNRTVYLDDFECRIFNGAALTAAPTASIDASHQGTDVDITDKNISVSFAAGTDNLMDTTTYVNGISVYEGTTQLAYGADYTISFDNTKDVKIDLAGNMLYSTTYSVVVSDLVKNLVGTAAAQASFSFTTQARPQSGENDTPQVTLSGIKDKMRVDPDSNLNITATVRDSDGIESVRLFVDGALEETKTAEPYTFSVSLAEGTHTLEVTATDTNAEPLTGTSGVYTVTAKANTATELAFSIQDGFVFFCQGDITVSAEGTDADGEEISAAELSIDGSPVGTGRYKGEVSVGTHTLAATVTDSNGNVYSDEIGFEYRPEYKLGDNAYSFDFDTSDAEFSNVEGIATGVESVDEAHGDSFYFEGAGASAGASPLYEKWDYWHGHAVASYDFYAEDIAAQDIIFPSCQGSAVSGSSPVRIHGGNIVNVTTNEVFGTLESGKWYHVEMIADSYDLRMVVNVAGYQFVFDDFSGSSERYICAIRISPYLSAGIDGKKLYVDNINIENYGINYQKLKKVEAIDANGTAFEGKAIPASTQYFIVTPVSAIPADANPAQALALLKNGTEVGFTAELYGASGSNNGYSYYRQVKLTPSDALEAGQEYTIVLKEGAQSYPITGTIWSSSRRYSLCRYTEDKVACSEGFHFENAAIYDGDSAVASISAIASGNAKFALDASNVSGQAKNIYLIIAAYDGDKLLEVKTAEAQLAAGEEAHPETPALSVSGADRVCGFIWEGIETLVPYASPVSIE